MVESTAARAAVLMTAAVGEAIRDLKEVRSGILYAHLCGTLSIDSYDAIIGTLVRAGLVRRDPDHLLVWIGPVAAPRGWDGITADDDGHAARQGHADEARGL